VTGRLLVVDDDHGVTDTFARMLTLEGHQVRVAHNAEDALREADAADPDAIIVDLRMPFINGLGFVYRLRERPHHRDTPVVIVTGDYFMDESMAAELQQLGVSVKFKPLWLDDLADLARTMLSESRRISRPLAC
jgi:DNA-binding response OmpR family regulator